MQAASDPSFRPCNLALQHPKTRAAACLARHRPQHCPDRCNVINTIGFLVLLIPRQIPLRPALQLLPHRILHAAPHNPLPQAYRTLPGS